MKAKLPASVILIMLAIITFSCEKSDLSRVGFNTEVEHHSKGVTLMWVDGGVPSLYLRGEVTVTSGTMTFRVTDPDDFMIYELMLEGPQTYVIEEKFPSKGGYWTLGYKSNEGVGAVDLHLGH